MGGAGGGLPSGMFEVSVRAEFCAAHALSIAGVREPVHGHNWKVTAAVRGGALDGDGLLCDFHTVEAALREIVAPFDNADLNKTAAFEGVNPSAENVARYIAERLGAALNGALSPHAAVAWVSITEAPGCLATYHLPRGPGDRPGT